VGGHRRHLYFNGRLWEAMGGMGGFPPNFFYFTFIIEYFGYIYIYIFVYIHTRRHTHRHTHAHTHT